MNKAIIILFLSTLLLSGCVHSLTPTPAEFTENDLKNFSSVKASGGGKAVRKQ